MSVTSLRKLPSEVASRSLSSAATPPSSWAGGGGGGLLGGGGGDALDGLEGVVQLLSSFPGPLTPATSKDKVREEGEGVMPGLR